MSGAMRLVFDRGARPAVSRVSSRVLWGRSSRSSPQRGVCKMFRRLTLSALFLGVAITHGSAQTLPPLLDPDGEADRINWYDLNSKFGPPPKPSSDTRFGGVVKTFVNKFWRATAD